MADAFVIRGLSGKSALEGEIVVSGAKNAALPVMAAAALVEEGEVILENVPDVSDVVSMGRLLEGAGAFVTRKGNSITIRSERLSGTVLDSELAKSIRASILLAGPLLARLGHVAFPHPGGCVIGTRPIDIFLDGFRMLGATCERNDEMYTLSTSKGLSGGEIFFRVVSVTATETFMMAATNAKAPVILKNCAMEPEVVAMADFLKQCGAKIEGAGTPTIIIFPSALIAPPPFTIIPDRIETAGFLILGALAAKNLTVRGVRPDHLDSVLNALSSMGVPLEVRKDVIAVGAPDKLLPTEIRTHEYPGFPTDAQAPITVLLTQVEGESTVLETVFDGRLNYTADLVRMGANIQLWNPHRAIVKGKTPLKDRAIEGPDIRAGLAFILAAAIAEGESKIGNAHLIDRGYEKIEEKLEKIGLSITRVRS